MKQYTCPMHPDVIRDLPGRCPKCGMDLVVEGTTVQVKDIGLGPITWKSYLPLIFIIGSILTAAFCFSLFNYGFGEFFFRHLIAYFMAGFFLVFSLFKLIDLRGFAIGYSTYDILAKRIFVYGYIYPFIELFFGVAMAIDFSARWLLPAEVFLMAFSGLGVAIKLSKKEKFQCVCLGTFLKVPLTYITLIEDFGMALLALLLLML